MKLICKNYKVKNYLTLIPLGDMHFGSKDCDVKVFEAHLEMIKKMKDCAVILMGDLINTGTRDSVGAGSYDDIYTPEEQYEKMIEYLMPIKDKIIGALQGNHEERVRNSTSFDINKLFAEKLQVPYLQYGGLLKLRVNDINYHVYAIHGGSCATTLSGKMNACRKMADKVNADIYLHAHTHGLDYSPQIYYEIDNRNKMIVEKIKHFVLTGSFTIWDGSYGEMKSLNPSPLGVPKIRLYGDLSRGAKKIKVEFTDR